MIFHILLGPFEFFCSEHLFCSKATELEHKKKQKKEEERTALGREWKYSFECVEL